MLTPRVLVVEDNEAIRRGLVDALSFAGYRTQETGDGQKGLELALEGEPDLVLLDLVLPSRDGFSVLEEVRRTRPTLPVIVLTARGAENDRVRGLKEGADDYVVKPFSAKELLARVEAVLRRTCHRPPDEQSFEVAGRRVCLDRRELSLPEGDVRRLSEKETAILAYLHGHRGRAVPREELIQRVWGLNPRGMSTRAVDMHIARLRDKFEDPGDSPEVIVTVRGAGYMLGG